MTDVLHLVTARKWREQLASFLLGEGEPEELEKCCPRELLLHWFDEAYHEAPGPDPCAAAEWYLSQNSPFVPAPVVSAVLEDRKPKKGGRHSRREEWARQKASDAACYLAMKCLRGQESNLSQTAAGERVGRLMHLSCQAVVRAWKKETQALGNPPETHP